MNAKARVVFLDRDGVLIEDVDLLSRVSQLRILPGVPEALAKLHEAGFQLVVVSNQAIVARGVISEDGVAAINRELADRLVNAGGPKIEKFYICPHHPKATLPAYRVDCECRKPRPGMLLQAARELNLDLSRSFMIGDRITDVIAGAKAGCRTVLVQTGQHLAAPIETSDSIDPAIRPDWTCANLPEAAQWIFSLS